MPLDLLDRGVHIFLIQGGEINEHMLIHKLLSTDKKMKNHLNYQTLMEYRHDLNCPRIIATHMSQDMIDRLNSLELEYAVDGKEIVL